MVNFFFVQYTMPDPELFPTSLPYLGPFPTLPQPSPILALPYSYSYPTLPYHTLLLPYSYPTPTPTLPYTTPNLPYHTLPCLLLLYPTLPYPAYPAYPTIPYTTPSYPTLLLPTLHYSFPTLTLPLHNPALPYPTTLEGLLHKIVSSKRPQPRFCCVKVRF